MKNILIRILACVLVLTMVFAFVACDKEEPAKDDEQTGNNNKPDPKPEEKCPDCGNALDDCTCTTDPELCPECGEPLDGCICDLEQYTPFTVPSASVIYGETVDTLTFNDVNGLWEVITDEGEDQGAALAISGAAIAVVDGVDFTKASKITISADIKTPTGSQTDCGFILDLWLDKEVSIFGWEAEHISYMFMYMNGANTIMSKLGAVEYGKDGAGWGAFENWWREAEGGHGYPVEYTDYQVTNEFQPDEYMNLKVEYDCANEIYTIYYNGVAVESADFEADIFTNQGENAVGIRTNGANIYYKNINLVVE